MGVCSAAGGSVEVAGGVGFSSTVGRLDGVLVSPMVIFLLLLLPPPATEALLLG